jgi:hypothetical protein
VRQNYFADLLAFRFMRLEDGNLRYERREERVGQ